MLNDRVSIREHLGICLNRDGKKFSLSTISIDPCCFRQWTHILSTTCC